MDVATGYCSTGSTLVEYRRSFGSQVGFGLDKFVRSSIEHDRKTLVEV